MISFMATAKLICVFVFAYAKSRFSHDAAHIIQHNYAFMDCQLEKTRKAQVGSKGDGIDVGVVNFK